MAQSTPEQEIEEPVDQGDLSEKVRKALETTVDLSRLGAMQAELAQRFNEKGYDTAFQLAEESVRQVGDYLKRYSEISWIFAIASAHYIVESSDKKSSLAKKARAILQESIAALEDGNFLESRGMLERLGKAVLDLYGHEMERHKEHVASHARALAEIRAMGGDVSGAIELLQMELVSLAKREPERYLESMNQLDEMIHRRREERAKEIQEASKMAMPGLKEALEKAIESGDFISANFLMTAMKGVSLEPQKRGEEKPLESEPSKQELVVEVEDKKADWVDRVDELIASIKPLIKKAKKKGQDAGEAQGYLDAAIESFNARKYADSLRMARKAYLAVKAIGERSSEKAKGQGKTKGEPSERPQIWCIYCGSTAITKDSDGNPKCAECGREIPYASRLDL